MSLLNESEYRTAWQEKNILLKDIRKHVAIQTLATQLTVSETKLKNIFKKAFGTSIYDFLLKARIAKAQYLLTQTDEPLYKIALQCGYKRVNNFNRLFKMITGVPLSEYRRNHRLQ